MIWYTSILAVLCAALAVALAVTIVRYRREHRAAAANRSVLYSAPIGVLRWTPAGWTANRVAMKLMSLGSDDAPRSTDDLVAFLPDKAAANLRGALDALAADRTVFEQSVQTAERNSLVLSGSWIADECAVWVRDDTAATWLAESFTDLEGEVTLLRGVLDMVPVPIWWRDSEDLRIVGWNRAYEDVAGPAKDGVAPELSASGQHGHDLAKLAMRTGSYQSESRHIVRGGTRRALSVMEGPIPGLPGAIGGSAEDLTALEDLQATLAEHIAVQDQVLEKLTSAIAVFGPDKRLKFFNTPYAQMWHVPERVLDEQPTISALLETLRERQQLPELSDFPAFKRAQDQLFTSLIDPIEQLLHLPDGRTIRSVTAPHPLGGLIFQYEDVTDRLALESSHNTLTAVQNSTLNSLLEGVCVFGRDGRMKLFNNVYAAMFGFDPDWLETGPHISDVIDAGRDLLNYEGEWSAARSFMIRSVSEPKTKTGEMSLTDDRVIRYAYIPLPDGQCLVLYLDITDTTQVETALRERNSALENADLLKSQFISSVSYELRTPLNAILGFAELLHLAEDDALNDRQRAYIDGIRSAGTTLSDLIEDMLDLAAVQAGFIALEESRIDLPAMVREVAAECAPADRVAQNAISNIEIAEPPADMDAYADAARLRKSLTKLFSAAVSMTPPDSPVRITWTPEDASGGQVAFHIETEISPKERLSWSDLVLGPTTDVPGVSLMLDSSRRAAAADLAVRLGRSLIYAQNGELARGDTPGSLICRLPAAE